MDTGFKYRPRFKDIRIRPPGGKPAEEVTVCEYPRCQEHATAKAPKAPDRLNEHYHFCQKHAAEYNKSWNFFEGMSEGAAQAYAQSAAWGHRPTWNFRAGGTARAKAQRASTDWQSAFIDPFSMFGERPPPGHANGAAAPKGPQTGRLQQKALDALGLEASASKSDVRKRYAELVRAYHPDANGGDRSREEALQRVVASYQILKSAGMA